MKTIALVGDRSPAVRAHTRIPAILDALREQEGTDLDAYWIPTTEAADPGMGALDAFDGIWLVPGSPYASEQGAVQAVRTARTAGIPFLGTCGGFQHAMLEFAREVCGVPAAWHAENGGGEGVALIEPLACSLVGHQATITLTPGSRAAEIIGAVRTVEGYHCSYGLAPGFTGLLSAHGMVFSGHDEDGEPRVAELPGHPFFVASLFQPELATAQPHPLIRGFARAVSVTAALAAR